MLRIYNFNMNVKLLRSLIREQLLSEWSLWKSSKEEKTPEKVVITTDKQTLTTEILKFLPGGEVAEQAQRTERPVGDGVGIEVGKYYDNSLRLVRSIHYIDEKDQGAYRTKSPMFKYVFTLALPSVDRLARGAKHHKISGQINATASENEVKSVARDVIDQIVKLVNSL